MFNCRYALLTLLTLCVSPANAATSIAFRVPARQSDPQPVDGVSRLAPELRMLVDLSAALPQFPPAFTGLTQSGKIVIRPGGEWDRLGPREQASIVETIGGRAVQDEYDRIDTLLVHLRGGAQRWVVGQQVTDDVIVRRVDLPNRLLTVTSAPGSVFSREVLLDLVDGDRFRYVEANCRYRAFEGGTPACNPMFGDQWTLQRIDVQAAWDAGLTSMAGRIALLDSGVAAHSDLPETAVNVDLSSDADASAVDGNGHGTMMAGVIGALTDNCAGIVGILRDTPIVNIQVLNTTDNDASCDEMAAAIRRAVTEDARIINASWGGATKCDALEQAVIEAEKAGVLIVAAAGNVPSGGQDLDAIVDGVEYRIYPACYSNENIISVMAVNADDGVPLFSNYGVDAVDIAAPGFEVATTIVQAGVEDYYDASGTSIATACVTGGAALAWAARPDAAAGQIREQLIENARPVTGLKCMAEGVLHLAFLGDGSPVVATASTMTTDEPAEAGAVPPGPDDAGEPIECEGTLLAPRFAAGGETSGVVIDVDGERIELDIGGRRTLLQLIETLRGQRVRVVGRVRMVEGIERDARRVITVQELEAR